MASWRNRVLGLVIVLSSGSALAQDDWTLTREPSPNAPVKRVVRTRTAEEERAYWLRALLADPESDHAVERLRAVTPSLDETVAHVRVLQAARPGDDVLRRVLARLLIASGAIDDGFSMLAQSSSASAKLRARMLGELGRPREAAEQWLSLASGTANASAKQTFLREAVREQLRAGEPELALTTLSRLDRAQLENPTISAMRVEALRASGRPDELAALLERRHAWREAAAVREERGDRDQAVSALRTHLRAHPTDEAARIDLAALLSNAGSPNEARTVLLEGAQRSRRTELWLRWADLSRVTGHAQDARARLEARSKQRPADGALHRALAELYTSWGDEARAQREHVAHEGASSRVEDPIRAALDRGERPEALRLLRARSATTVGAGAENFARALEQYGFLPEAVEQARRVVSLAPTRVENVVLLAGLLERTNQLADAERAWMRVLTFPNASQSQRREAREHAVSAWHRAGTTQLHTAELEARLRRGWADDDAKVLMLAYERDPARSDDAAQLLARLYDELPNDVEVLQARERACLARRDFAGALTTRARWLAQVEPEEAQSASLDAIQLAAAHRDVSAAEPLVSTAIARAGNAAAVQRAAAAFYLARGDRNRAARAYAAALAIDTDDDPSKLALARLSLEEGATVRARSLLRDLARTAATAEFVTAAAELLLQSNGTTAVADLVSLVGRTRDDDALSAVLMRHWSRSLLPRVQRSDGRDGRALVLEAVPVLRRVLVHGTPAERAMAIATLRAAPDAAADALLALAIDETATLEERALALTALAPTPSTTLAAELEALAPRAPRALQPFVTWALREQPLARPHLRGLLAHRDENLRGWAALLTTDLASLRTLLGDTSRLVRVAAASALLARGVDEPAMSSVWSEALPEPALASALVVAAGAHAHWTARALFADGPLRDAASAVMNGATSALSAPRYPFSLARYLEAIGHSAAPSPPHFEGDLDEIARAAVAALSSDDERVVEVALAALAVQSGRLVPRALLGACPAAGDLARPLHPVLAALLRGRFRLVAQDLLVRSGGASEPALQARLEQASGFELRALMRSLAHGPALPDALRPLLRRATRESPDWPTRMWAARALTEPKAVAADEPMPIVRAYAELAPGAAPPHDECASISSQAN